MTTGNIIDIVIGVLALVSIVSGAVRGLFKSVLSFVSLGGSAFGAYYLSGKFSKPVMTFVYPYIEDKAASIAGVVKASASEQYVVSDELLTKLQALGVDTSKLSVGNLIPADSLKDMVINIAQPVAKGVLIILLFVAIFVVLKLFIHLFDKAIKSTKLIKGANSLLGAVLGFIEVAAILYCLCLVMTKFNVIQLVEEPVGQSIILSNIMKIIPQ